MPLKLVRENITAMQVDAIVNAANNSLLGGGGVDGAIHRAAGKQLLEECRTLNGCETGDAKITWGYNLPAKYVIHTVGPVWRGGEFGEEELLKSCYKKSLQLALDHNCQTVAFPLISGGVYGYPKTEALHIAVNTVAEFLNSRDITVYITLTDKTVCAVDESTFLEINGLFIKKETPWNTQTVPREIYSFDVIENTDSESRKIPPELDDAVNQLDESFSEMLLRKIDEAGITDVECYKRANIDRKLFSKIRGDAHYHPGKQTAIAFAVALKLSLEETGELLMKAGFALSHSNKFDIIIEYFIENKNYNIYEINEALFEFDQPLLGE